MTEINPSIPFSAAEVDDIIGWARQAGTIALDYFKNVTVERKADHTFVTEADRAVEKFLVARLRAAYPDHALVGEEGARSDLAADSAYIWAIDPIDGTTVFVQGLTGWGITLGLLHQGRPAFGLFYNPQLDELTYTGHDGHVYHNGRRLTNNLRVDWADKGFLATSSTAHFDFQLDIKRLRALGSISSNLVYTARGIATATFSPNASLWDLVAGGAMLLRLGGELRYLSGKSIDYLVLLDGQKVPEPVIAGHPQVVAEVQGRIGEGA